MADKKIIQLNTAAALTINDLIMLCQDAVTGELLQADLGALQSFILGGANAGARIYFNSGVPDDSQGVDGDVAFDKTNKDIYAKIAGIWVLQDSYGAPESGVGILRFTANYGSDELSADGLTLTSEDLEGGDVVSVKVDATELIRVETLGTSPAFDEFDFDTDTGVITFGAPLPEGFRISIIYSF